MIKYIFFDVAGTLLGKPTLFSNIQKALNDLDHIVDLAEIKNKHKLLSEVIHFPDRTDKGFYDKFNSELLYLLGIVPTEELLGKIFDNCTYLPWKEYEDTKVLNEIKIPIGVISNFNSTLKDKLKLFFDVDFQNVLVSEELGVAKPNIEFYQKALDRIGFESNEVLYVGDSIKLDLEPASKIGFNTLIIDRDNFYPNFKNRISNLSEIKKYL
ncbi:HAD superfamily hydrolase (TIGR01549 family) [Flavobacterium sp. 103]|uniref:HAD family hydrolase n=1 Tax=Flavobacterium sp. 103 TaxID=2135624 RepID=UPI000D5F083E|nr:HAD family hydrolase [Flavobacterium sp. 103]PVX46587.1 HAD superfamily hydrolase (TIGR01549 family) [Flavobacterium sp. 103]